MPRSMLAFRDTDGVAELEDRVFGAKASKSKLRRSAYRAVLKRLAALQEANGYTQEEMARMVASLGSTPTRPVALSVIVRTKRGAK